MPPHLKIEQGGDFSPLLDGNKGSVSINYSNDSPKTVRRLEELLDQKDKKIEKLLNKSLN